MKMPFIKWIYPFIKGIFYVMENCVDVLGDTKYTPKTADCDRALEMKTSYVIMEQKRNQDGKQYMKGALLDEPYIR